MAECDPASFVNISLAAHHGRLNNLLGTVALQTYASYPWLHLLLIILANFLNRVKMNVRQKQTPKENKDTQALKKNKQTQEIKFSN
jgi:hypothetical protein